MDDIQDLQVLEKEIVFLDDELTKSFDLIDKDPASCVVKCGNILERLIKNLHKNLDLNIPKKEDLGGLINNNQFTRLLPDRIVLRMHSVRAFRNLGSHDKGPVKLVDASNCFDSLLEIIKWYAEEYGELDCQHPNSNRKSSGSCEIQTIKKSSGIWTTLSFKFFKFRSYRVYYLVGMFLLASIVLTFFIHFNRQPLRPDSPLIPKNQAAIDKTRLNQFNPLIQKALQIAYTSKIPSPAPKAAVTVMTQMASDIGGAAWRELGDGEKLSTQNIYKIMFFPDSQAYVYVIQIDSQGKLDWLFPENTTNAYSSGQNPVPAKKWTQTPANDNAFRLDDNIGIEHLYIIVTQSRWIELEQALEASSRISDKNLPVNVAMNFKLRGVGGIVKTASTPDKIKPESAKSVQTMMEGREGVLVFEKWFHHVRLQ